MRCSDCQGSRESLQGDITKCLLPGAMTVSKLRKMKSTLEFQVKVAGVLELVKSGTGWRLSSDMPKVYTSDDFSLILVLCSRAWGCWPSPCPHGDPAIQGPAGQAPGGRASSSSETGELQATHQLSSQSMFTVALQSGPGQSPCSQTKLTIRYWYHEEIETKTKPAREEP